MKNYFGFILTGKKLLPLWLTFYGLYIIPYVWVYFKLINIQPGDSTFLAYFILIFVLSVFPILISFFIAKLGIEHIKYKDKSIVFNSSFGKFIGIILLGYFLSLITFGIYSAWFTRDLLRFFVDNSSYDSKVFKFLGEGSKLFFILLIFSLIFIVIITITMIAFPIEDLGQSTSLIVYIQQIFMWIIMIPYMYFVYKWVVNIAYKNYNITWRTDFWSSCGKILLEMFFSIITLGIYYPMAMLKLYKYFIERTSADTGDLERNFGFESDNVNDFLFIWKQLLLSIVTLGIYYPWAISKIGNRILSKTYLE